MKKSLSDKTAGEYYAAMGTEAVTVTELAERLNLPPDRVRRSLRILKDLGSVTTEASDRYRRKMQERTDA